MFMRQKKEMALWASLIEVQTQWDLLFFKKHASRVINGDVLLRNNLSAYLFKVRFASD